MPSTPLIACSSGVVTARLDLLRVGAGVDRVDRDLRRRQRRILRDRHRRDGDGAGEDDDERADRREDRPADEGIDEHVLLGFHGRAVADLLDARHDQLFARLEAAGDDVVVAEDLADLDGRWRATRPSAACSATKQKYWPLMRDTAVIGTVSPGAERQMTRIFTNCWIFMSAGASFSSALRQHRLRRGIDARRDEA